MAILKSFILDNQALLARLYARFNARDIEAVLAMMQPDVAWANGMDGGHVHGRDGVRAYWTRQWAMIDPRVEPLTFKSGQGGETEVEVRQIVRALDGAALSDTIVVHRFLVEDGLIRRFEIG